MSTTTVNQEFRRCWPPFRDIVSETVRKELLTALSGMEHPAVDVRFDAAPAFTALPDPATGGLLELSIPEPGSSWSLRIAGQMRLAAVPGFGQRAFSAELTGLRITAGLTLSPPHGSDPRPRLVGAQALTLAIDGHLFLEVVGVGTFSSD